MRKVPEQSLACSAVRCAAALARGFVGSGLLWNGEWGID